jgi:aldehyde dehydrogenase (NAD+)
MWEYLKPSREPKSGPKIRATKATFETAPSTEPGKESKGLPTLDRTAKLYIGGKQTRPDSGYSYTVRDARNRPAGQAGLGNRKDIRNAVEAAHKASGWTSMSGHARAQVLYFLAENLEARGAEFAARLIEFEGGARKAAQMQVAQAVSRLTHYAAYADKFDGQVHSTVSRHVTLAMNEPWGVLGISCPDQSPLLAFVSLVAPAIAMGNRVVVTPSPVHPLLATDFYQVIDTSDVPPGVINIVTGDREALSRVIAEHDDVAAAWYFGTAPGGEEFERASAGNLKATWVNDGIPRDWSTSDDGQGREFLRRATQVKNIWIPYGE